MPLLNAKKHVNSIAHKKKEGNRVENAQLDNESKEMRKLTKNGVIYLCQPCGFQVTTVSSEN